MKVLLVSANTERINMAVMPLGMACVARAAEDAGHHVSQINLLSTPDALNDLRARIQMLQPDVIGISVRNIDDQVSAQPRFLLEPVKAIVSACRKHSQATLVLGGAGYSIFPRDALEYLGADMGIQGEGERSFVTLLHRLENKLDLSTLAGLFHRSLGIANPPTVVKDINSLPLPQPGKHLQAMEQPPNEVIWVPIQTRRGCPMNCSYCSTATIEGRIIRKRAPSQIIAALAAFASHACDHFFFVDNTFNLPTAYTQALCDQIRLSGLKIKWRAILYPWKIDEALVAKMAASGCVEVSLGFESGSDVLLRKMNKHYRTRDVRRASEWLKAYGIHRMGFLLLGSPGESRQTVLESLEFADSLELEAVKVTVGLRIYPHTALAEHARRKGRLSSADSLLFPRFYFEDGMERWIRPTVERFMQGRPHWFY